jgi:hypothetical protein
VIGVIAVVVIAAVAVFFLVIKPGGMDIPSS